MLSRLNIPLQILAAILAAVGCINTGATYQSGDPTAWNVGVSAGPLAGGALASVLGFLSMLSGKLKDKDKDKNVNVPTFDLLKSIETIVNQFKTKGLPDSLDATLTWGGESYEFKWAKRETKK